MTTATPHLSPSGGTRDPKSASLEKLSLLRKFRQQQQEASGREQKIPRADRSHPLPASFGQEQLWLLDRLEPGTSVFNMTTARCFLGELDGRALEACLAEIVRRHEALRTTFALRDGEVTQQVSAPGRFRLPSIDLSALAEDERRRRVDELIAAESATPFDLARGPLFRAVLLRPDRREHVLLLSCHHIVSDGWSFGVLFNELSALYEAAAAGRPLEGVLEPLDVQYADFAAWQRAQLTGERLEEHLAYWRGELAGAPPELDLPTDWQRTTTSSHRGGDVACRLGTGLTAALRTLSQREKVTLFTTLLAAFKLLLHRYTGQDEIVVGAPSAGRTRAETRALIGFFLNTLVLRTRIGREATFRELLRDVGTTVSGAFAHQDVPMDKLLAELQPQRHLSRTPLFQVLFNMVNLPGSDDASLPGLEARGIPLPRVESKFDFTWYVSESGGEVEIAVVYATDLFRPERMEEMLSQYRALLEQAVADPERRIDSFSLVTERARAVLPRPDAPLDDTWRGPVHAHFSRQAARRGDHAAVVDPMATWSYGELERRGNQLAHHLRRHGVGTGDVVAIWAHRSASLVWALLATMKAGGAFVILDPVYPGRRLAEYVRQARPRAWLEVEGAGEPPAELTAALDGAVCRLRLPPLAAAAETALLEEERGDDPAVPLGADDLAYLAFTSGSTGRPKGILGRHGPLTHFLPWLAETFGFDEDDRHALLSALSHDPLQRDVLYPLAFGATLRVPDPERLFSPGYLARWLAEEGVTVVNLVPAMLRLLTSGDGERPRLPRLRRAFVVGDVLTHEDVAALYGMAPEAVCVNLYGSTETQRAVSFHVVSRESREHGDDRPRKAVLPLGRGFEDVQLLVLSPAGGLAGVGELGEICFRSPHLARGYLDDEASRERFVPNPATGETGDRLYRTGDLGRYLPDGGVEFLGRADGQVKLRGFRIELGEVEAVLARHPAVETCAVTVRDDAAGRGDARRLVAYLVPDGPEPAERELRGWLGARLPDYMVPAAFVFLGALPLSPTGKVDHRALPAPPAPRTGAVAGFAAPPSPEEETVASIWCDVLDLEQVGPDDDFFELGGHSLLAMQLLSRLRQAFGVEPTLRQLFESPTVRGLAAVLLAARQAGKGLGIPPLVPTSGGGVEIPLSFAQQRIWFLEQLVPQSTAHLISAALLLEGPLDSAALERCFTEIVRRHAVLRTSFPSRDGRAFQQIAPGAPHALPRVDLGRLDAAGRQREAQRLTAREAGRPFDVERGPLARTTLLELGAREHVLLLSFHHLVFDGWSFRVLLGEMVDLYEAWSGAGSETPSPLPPLAVQYSDFALWEHEWLRGDALEAQLAWWRRHLAGAPPVLELPADRPRPAEQTLRGAWRATALPPALGKALEKLARGLGATPFMVLLASFETLLRRCSHQDDLVVGVPVARRNRVELESLVGLFANTLALRTRLAAARTFAELVGQVREATLGASAHQETPFEKLVDELVAERDMSHSPIFQVMFNLQRVDATSSRCGELTLTSFPVELRRAQFDLTLMAARVGETYRGRLEYNADLFDTSTAERFLRAWRRLLEGAVAASGALLAELPVLDAAERHQLLLEHNDTATPVPEMSLPRLFEAQAGRVPAAAAVELAGEVLSYRELDRRANRLAHHLCRLGAGPEIRVGVLLERSLDMVAGLLAILKAGAAYVPLDPTYPRERLELMLRDSGAALLLTHGELADELDLPGAVRVLDLDRGRDRIAALPATAPAGAAEPGNLAYVIYTSGSTGKPKGVQITHRPLANFLLSMAGRPGFGPGDSLLAVTTICFDIAGLELFLPLVSGGRLVVASRETATDGRLLAAALETSRASVLQATPVTWRMLAASGWQPRWRLEVLCGGEALPADLAAALLERDVELWNVYGPTETTVWSMLRPIGAPFATGNAPIGRPLSNTRVYLFDRGSRLVPTGVAGELVIGGDGLARGYLGRPARTAERFVPDPTNPAAGERLYRTGDLARRRADGDVEFLGRVDHQVKLRGFRIELGEIEAALERHPEVGQAVVAVHGDTAGSSSLVPLRGNQQLVAYVRRQDGPGEPIGAGPLRAWLAESLPGYMVPAAWVFLDAFPLTPNGKVDRAALPAPTPVAAGPGFVAPETPEQQMMAAIWCNVLGIEEVGLHDNFFDLGGHSLLATQVTSQALKIFGHELPLRAVFDTPTVAGLVTAMISTVPRHRAAPIEPLPRGGAEPLPLSFAQERLWFLEQLRPAGSAYAAAFLPVALTGELRFEALERTFTELVRRHEVLRTTFRAEGGKPVQVAAPPSEHSLPRVDLGALGDGDRRHELKRVLEREQGRGFDLARGPLFRTLLLRLAPDEHVLVIANHHLVFDGWTLGVLIRELGQLYGAFALGLSPPLAPLPVQYGDFAVWQRRWLETEDFTSQLDYWRRKLEAPEATARLPLDRPRGSESRARSLKFRVPEATARSLRELGRQESSTLFMTLLAAFQVLLYRATRQATVAVGTPIANRHRPELENLVGFFVNTLVLVSDLGGNPSFRELLARVRTVALDAYAHQDVPFEKLVEVLRPERSADTQPLFQVLFTLQNAPASRFELRDLAISAVGDWERGDRAAFADLTLGLGEPGDELRGGWEYDETIFERATVEALDRGFLRLLDAVAHDPDGRIEELEAFGPEELRRFREKAEQALAEAPAGRSPATAAEVREKIRTEVAAGREQLSEAKRELLARRLRGKRAAGGPGRDRGEAPSQAAAVPGTTILPRDLLEFRLARIWEELLDKTPVGVRDDFFHLGGRSLLAARLSERIRDELGAAFPLAAVFEAPTVEQQAAILRREKVERPYSPLVAIRPGGSRPPFYCVHSADGGVVYYAELARLLGAEQPFYGLQARGVTSREPPLEDVREMAEHYLEAVRAHRGEGPYTLGGWSFGGWVALEMARRLRALGEEVLLVVFDTHVWFLEDGKRRALPSDETEWLAAFLEELAADFLPEELGRRDPDEVLAEVIEQAKAAARLPPDVTLTDARRRFRLFKAHTRATSRYRPEPYSGEVVLFRVTGDAYPEKLGWERIADDLEVVHVAGKHREMVLPPQVGPLAARLGRRLAAWPR